MLSNFPAEQTVVAGTLPTATVFLSHFTSSAERPRAPRVSPRHAPIARGPSPAPVRRGHQYHAPGRGRAGAGSAEDSAAPRGRGPSEAAQSSLGLSGHCPCPTWPAAPLQEPSRESGPQPGERRAGGAGPARGGEVRPGTVPGQPPQPRRRGPGNEWGSPAGAGAHSQAT